MAAFTSLLIGSKDFLTLLVCLVGVLYVFFVSLTTRGFGAANSLQVKLPTGRLDNNECNCFSISELACGL